MIKKRSWSKEIAKRYGILSKAPGAMVPEPKAPGTSRPRAAVVSEHFIEAKAEGLCRNLGLQFIRVPDAAYKAIFGTATLPTWVKVLIARYIKGLPDLTVLRKYGPYNLALCLELKTEEGSVSKGQKDWAKDVNVSVTYGWEQMEKAILDFADYNPEQEVTP